MSRARFCRIVTGLWISTLLSLLCFHPATAEVPTGYQEYYVLGNEEHAWRAFDAIYEGGSLDEICSTISLVATANRQIVYYDHWEDGYETDLLHPTQDSTEVYTLTLGTTLSLTSTASTTGSEPEINRCIPVNLRDNSQIRYDGGDRIITGGGPVALAHSMWPENDTWIGGAWEIYSRQAYKDMYAYTMPIGEDLYTFGGGIDGTYGDFRNVYIQLSAFEDDTTVSIDNGTKTIDLSLNRGQAYSSMGYINSSTAPAITVNASTAIHTNKPIQVGLMTGADSPTSAFQGRFMVMLPEQQWGADYVVPVPRGSSSSAGREAPAEIYLANPNDFPITIQAYDAEVGETQFVISPTQAISSTIPYSTKRGGGYAPNGSSIRFTSSDGVFGVVVTADTSETAYDWGFAGIGSKYLTKDYYVSWAPGSADFTGNGAPVWVAPAADGTTFYVDYSPLDGIVDETFELDMLGQQRIFDPDNDNSGMHIWATEKFAAAWGADPATASVGDPYLDLGISILPLQQQWIDPVLTLKKAVNPSILPEEGGSVTFTLLTQAYETPVADVNITDTLPLSWTYTLNSANITYPSGQSSQVEPLQIDRVLYWDLGTSLEAYEGLTLTFQAALSNTTGITISTNQAQAVGTHTFSGAQFNPSDQVDVYITPLSLVKKASHRVRSVGQTLIYTLTYENQSDSDTMTNVTVDDVLPVAHVTFMSASSGGTYKSSSGTVTWDINSLEPGARGVLTTAIQVKDFVKDGTVIENIARIDSDQTPMARSNAVHTLVYAPKLTFSKSGPTAAKPGDQITYTLSYNNAGRYEATGVMISDTLPMSTTYIVESMAVLTDATWVALSDASDEDMGTFAARSLIFTLGSVPAGASGQIQYSVQITDLLSPGAVILNAATLSQDLDVPRNSNLVATRMTDLLISKQAVPDIVPPGGIISYTLTYSNASATDAHTNVRVQDAIPSYADFVPGTALGGDEVLYSSDYGATWSTSFPITPVTHLRWQDDDLAPHAFITLSFAVQVHNSLPERTTIQNTAYVSSTETRVYLSQFIPSNEVLVPTVDLWIEKSVSADTVHAGDVVSYTIAYGNRGSADVPGAFISDILPDNTLYKADSIWGTGASDDTAPELSWAVGTIPAGATAYYAGYRLMPNSGLPAGTLITNSATLSSTYGCYISDMTQFTVTNAADLALHKMAYPETVYPTQILTYTLTYTNYGPSDAPSVTLSDTLPPNFAYGGVVSKDDHFTGPVRAGQQLTWYATMLLAGDSGTWVFTGTMLHQSGTALVNTASLTSTSIFDPDQDNNVYTQTTPVTDNIDLAISKVCAPSLVAPGSQVTCTLMLDNNGTWDVSDILVTDSVPSQINIHTVISREITLTPLQTTPTYVWKVDHLLPGHSGWITLCGTLDAGWPSGLLLTNTVSITGPSPDPKLSNNSSEKSIVIENVPPSVVDDEIGVLEEQAVTILTSGDTSLLHNDHDLNNEILEVVEIPVNPPSFGVLNLESNGTFTYTHDGSENREDTFIYEACDNGTPSLCDTGIVTVTVYAVNDPPRAADDEICTSDGSTVRTLNSGDDSVLSNDIDPDLPPDTLTVTLVSDVRYGLLMLYPDGTFVYTHTLSTSTQDGFIYQVCDDGMPQLCDTANVTITINFPPRAEDDGITVNEGGTATVLASGEASVLANDTDYGAPADALTATILTSPVYGSLSLRTDGTFTYTHDSSENHADLFTYRVCDGGVPSLCDTGTVSITIQPVNDAPAAYADYIILAEGGFTHTLASGSHNVLDNDVDPDCSRELLTVTLLSDVRHGTLTLNAIGTFSYTHDGSENHADTFRYQVCDTGMPVLCDTAPVTIQVMPVNDAPTAYDDTATVDEGLTVRVLSSGHTSVLDNDSDPDSLRAFLTAHLITDVTVGALTLNRDGTFSYTHDGSENYEDGFIYQVCDADGPFCDTASVTFYVNPINDPPFISDIPDVLGYVDTRISPRTFTVDDAESAPDALTLTIATSNIALLPQTHIDIQGTGITRTLYLTPAAGQLGEARLSIAVHDGLTYTSTSLNVTIAEKPRLYLPSIFCKSPDGPDLIVKALVVSANDIQLVIQNQGNRSIPAPQPGDKGFWIDVYVDPIIVPTHVNQTWEQVSTQGMVWAVRQAFAPGETLALRVDDSYYYAPYSHVEWPLSTGIWVYAQVDSANVDTDYGSVLEDHEKVNGRYNNILGVQYTGQQMQTARPSSVFTPTLDSGLPFTLTYPLRP